MKSFISTHLFIGKTQQTFDQGEYEVTHIDPDLTDKGELTQITLYGAIGAECGDRQVVPYWVLDLETVKTIAQIWNEHNQK